MHTPQASQNAKIGNSGFPGNSSPGALALSLMKALVLAGGAGNRLRPITHTSAKQLLPVANKPVLFYGLEAIRDAGITAVGIVVGDTARAIQGAVGDGSAFGLEVTYIRQEAPRGPRGDLALVGVYIFTPAVHEAAAQLAPSWRGELEITEAIQWLIDNGRKVRSTTITGYWKDTGNVADMLEVNRMVLESVDPV